MRRFGVRIPTSAQKEDFKFEVLFFRLKGFFEFHPVDFRSKSSTQANLLILNKKFLT